MNTRRNQWEIPRTPQNTNLENGSGLGYSLGLGRKTFIDELIAKVYSSTGAQYIGPSSMRRILVSPRLKASVSTVDISIGAATPSSVPVEGTPGDRVLLWD